MGKKIALGSETNSKIYCSIVKPLSSEDDTLILGNELIEAKEKDFCVEKYGVNVDGIPIGTTLIGRLYPWDIRVLTVQEDAYYLGINRYPSLNDAALSVNTVSVDGWNFWELPDGRAVAEVYK